MDFKKDDKVKYVGKGFMAYVKGEPFAIFMKYDGHSNAYIKYNGHDVLVYVYEIESV